MNTKEKALINFLKKRGGLVSYGEIYEAGFNRASLRKSLNSGEIQKLDRGLYRLSTGISLPNPDLVAVSIKVSKGVVCLLSALAFHEATNDIAKFVDVAIVRVMHANKI